MRAVACLIGIVAIAGNAPGVALLCFTFVLLATLGT